MKKSLFALSLLLSMLVIVGCPVVPGLPTITITPSSVTLGTGESQVFTASIADNPGAVFNWTVKSGQGTLSSSTGKSVTYTAPAAQGVYTISVDSLSAAKAAVATITVASRLNAGGDSGTPILNNGAIAAGETQRYIVNVPSSIIGANDVLYFELQTMDNVKLSLYDDNQNLIAQSNNPEFFSKSLSSSSALESQIVTNVICRGPCVIVKKNAGTYYLKLESTTAATYKLFVFPDIYADKTEPNDSANCVNQAALLAPAITINPEPVEAAIETLDDVDCFTDSGAMKQVVLKTIANTAIKLKAEIRDADTGTVLGTLSAGPSENQETFTLTTARKLKVFVTGDDQAGPGANSRYTLDFQP